MKVNNNFRKIILLIGDMLLLPAALFVVLSLRYPSSNAHLVKAHFKPFLIIFTFWIILFGAFGLYDLRFNKNSKTFLYHLIKVMAANMVLAIIIFYFLPFFEIEPRRNLLLIGFFTTAFIFIWHYLFNLFSLRTQTSKVIFFGINKDVAELADSLLKNPQLGQRPVAFIADGEDQLSQHQLPVFTLETGKLAHIISDTGADTIVVTHEIKENTLFVKMLLEVLPLGISVIEFISYHESLTGKISLSVIGEVWFLENLIGIRKPLYEFFKRGLDMVLAIILAIPTLLTFPFIALAIKLDSAGPIFYRQKRAGRNGKEFWFIKYRSMVNNAEHLGGLKGNDPDSRHTRVGVFLRKSYLDELPQIWNVLKGEMSVVGPRPERPEYVAQLKEKIPFYEMRLLVPPGLTGWAQINMENDASVEDAPEKIQYDLYYTKNRSLVLDLLISARTIFTLLRRQGR